MGLVFTDLGRYDLALTNWINKQYGESNMKKAMRRLGYAEVPDDILVPYSIADVDLTRRCVKPLKDQLKQMTVSNPYTVFGSKVNTLYDMYRYVIHPATAPLNEMERTGMLVDRDRMESLVELFIDKLEELSCKFQEMINWPGFSFRSTDDVREFLFGNLPGGKPRKRPDGAVTLRLKPVKTTDKPSSNWDTLSDKAKYLKDPSTDAEVLEILALRDTRADRLRELRVADQIRKNFLRPMSEDKLKPKDPETGKHPLGWVGGLVLEIDDDLRMRTNIGQITDTGRWTSSSPNLQNLPKRQEAELRRIFSTDRKKMEETRGWAGMPETELKELGLLPHGYYSIRSCFVAPPGEVIMEADYTQAELNVLAFLAQDPDMMAIMMDSTRDLHSEMAHRAFNLDCTAEEVSKLHPNYRVMAKNINFGISYGRGAAALARQIKREGVDTDEKETRRLISVFFDSFPRVKDYIQMMHQRVRNPGYVENAFGRRRIFFETTDGGTIAAQQREAVNMPIQGTVADALAISVVNLQQLRDARNMRSKIMLPVHDAIFTQVPVGEVEDMKEIYKIAMSDGTEIPGIGLKLGIDIEVMRRWGEKMSEADAIAEAIESKKTQKTQKTQKTKETQKDEKLQELSTK
jgi:DNA polymerase I-like protein with 3'-5' exonuclease and polymerase domains